MGNHTLDYLIASRTPCVSRAPGRSCPSLVACAISLLSICGGGAGGARQQSFRSQVELDSIHVDFLGFRPVWRGGQILTMELRWRGFIAIARHAPRFPPGLCTVGGDNLMVLSEMLGL